jgi:hypothetical protein
MYQVGIATRMVRFDTCRAVCVCRRCTPLLRGVDSLSVYRQINLPVAFVLEEFHPLRRPKGCRQCRSACTTSAGPHRIVWVFGMVHRLEF